jgi:hypothetical protein
MWEKMSIRVGYGNVIQYMTIKSDNDKVTIDNSKCDNRVTLVKTIEKR